ncbi:calcium-binding protein [Pacificibacter marinus]|uniref:calcium-binding protein n=1 Tax=Pacificibacter marinus TaxID=658057 RepID=UPI001C06CB74|nr:calcium-binding protein [Pacificibacter marinus]MBU2868962.1 hypothetical protein [Pacificibacter marinus]
MLGLLGVLTSLVAAGFVFDMGNLGDDGETSTSDNPNLTETPIDTAFLTDVSAGSGEEDDTFIGSADSDTFRGFGGNDLIVGNEGNDDLRGNGGDDIVSGGSGDDRLDGGYGDDQIYGDHGDDNLIGNLGDDTVLGGAGNDTINAGQGEDTAFGGDGNDTIRGYGGSDYIEGNEGRDDLRGNGGNDIVLGGDGNDRVDGGAGDDSLFGNAGVDMILGKVGDDLIFGGEGSDRIWGGDGNDVVSGEADNDSIRGGGGNDLLSGDAGDDDLRGNGGDDGLSGGDGNDQINGGWGNDVLLGENGDDNLIGNSGNDILNGGAGVDTLDGGEGDDTLYVDGEDSASGGEGNDTFITWIGDGAATIEDFDPTQDSLQIQIDAGKDVGALTEVTLALSDNGSMTVSHGSDVVFVVNPIEGVILTEAALDTISVHAHTDPFDPATDGDVTDLTDESTQEPDDVANDDDIEADDRITETSVNGHSNFQLELDTQTTEPAPIITDFETAEDTLSFVRVYAHDEDVLDLSFVEREDGLGVNLMNGETVLAEIHRAQLEDFEDTSIYVQMQGDGTLHGSDEANRIGIDSADDQVTIYGNGGDDELSASKGDTLFGGEGNDVLWGSGALLAENIDDMNVLDGGEGDDTILSNNANVLTGGAGADTFGLSLSQYSGSDDGGSGHDLAASVITDFNIDEDVIYIEGAFISQAQGFDWDGEEVLSIVPWDDGTGADLYAGDEVIAEITGGQGLTVADIKVAENGLETELLGYH